MGRIEDLIEMHCPAGVEFKSLGEVIRPNFGERITKLKDSGTAFPVYGGGGESFRTNSCNRTDDWVISRFAMSERCVRYVHGDFWLLDSGFSFDVLLAGVEKDYVGQILLNLQPIIYETSTTSAQKNIDIEGFKKLQIPLPPLEVQREIVRVLDAFQELEAELEAELEVRREQYVYYRRELLTYDAGGSDVEFLKLAEVANFTNAKAHERVVDPEGEIALLTARFISTQGRQARYVKQVDVRTPAVRNQTALVMSDLPNGRALARAFFIDEDEKYAANQRVCLVDPKDETKVFPRFLYYILDRNQQLLRYDSGFDQTHLSKDQILGIRIPVPAMSEQLRVVAILDKFYALVNDISVGLPAELKARRQQYEYYRDRLLSFEAVA
jgi:type I restriction enzyme S subunit